jgi:hypothetical protein
MIDILKTYYVEFELWRLPHRYGYLRTHKSCLVAKRQATQSRDAFAVLAAVLSMFISKRSCNEFNLSGPVGEPEWVKLLLSRGAHPSWVSEFKYSDVAQFSERIRRVGVIVRPGYKYRRHVPAMNYGKVPFWIQWLDHQKDWHGDSNNCQEYFPSENAGRIRNKSKCNL